MAILLTQAQAQAWTGGREWQKGQPYVGDLTGLTAQPDGEAVLLRAQAHGQDSYGVSARLRSGQVMAAACACPVGGGGHCKHVAALLARAARALGDFRALPDLGQWLSGMSAETLRAAVRTMLEREPDLIRVLLMHGPATDRGNAADDLRRRTELAFDLVNYDPEQDWEGEGPDLNDLRHLMDELEGRLRRAGDLTPEEQAEVVDACAAFLEGCAELDDEDYDLGLDELISPARTGLLRLLGLSLSPELREVALDTLHESVADLGWSLRELDAGDREQAGLFAALPQEDRQLTLSFLRGLISGLPAGYRRRQATTTLHHLTPPGSLGDADALALARETGQALPVIDLLLRQHRLGDALAELEQAPGPLAHAEPLFAAAGQLGALEDFARTRLGRPGARAWLYGRPRAQGQQDEAYALARAAVLDRKATPQPSRIDAGWVFSTADIGLEWLAELRAVSPDWPADREQYVQQLWKQPAMSGRLLAFLLDEGEAERAARLAQERRSELLGAPLLARLAGHLGAERAKPLYLSAVMLEVAGRNREHYARAAGFLKDASAVIGEAEARSVARLLRAEFPRLSALRDELKQAGLL
ncbi:SWIM zinc finger family protein [Deinococcus petrolearius]|uniref:SWIM zinc finger domain-containing protein n=1 Tax=Deinococcus petrolearius TaxID=1751295 RepID=A0ABW1DI59_9DEIO